MILKDKLTFVFCSEGFDNSRFLCKLSALNSFYISLRTTADARVLPTIPIWMRNADTHHVCDVQYEHPFSNYTWII